MHDDKYNDNKLNNYHNLIPKFIDESHFHQALNAAKIPIMDGFSNCQTIIHAAGSTENDPMVDVFPIHYEPAALQAINFNVRGYKIWFMPTPESHTKFEEIMQQHVAELQTKNSQNKVCKLYIYIFLQ